MSVVQRRILWFAVTIFISSALIMILEIAAARLIAPYLGVSLYTWTSIIGVVLAGLSLGNWIGGVWADRGAGEFHVGIVLILSGITTLAILLLLIWAVPLILSTGMNLLSASLLLVGSLFFIPAFLMGIVMPLLMTLALKLDARTGHIVGKMEALAAFGSIVGTFLAGFWLIQYFGTRIVLVAIAITLFLLAIPFLWRVRAVIKAYVFIAVSFIGGLTYWQGSLANPCDRESSYYCIRVVNLQNEVSYGTAKGMVLDHLLHSMNFRESPAVLLSPYVHLMDELISLHFQDQRNSLKYFFAGGGAYTQPRAIKARWPDSVIDVAELDSEVTDTAEQQLWLNKDGINIFHEDARVNLNRQPAKKYDVIIGDVFHDITIPYHLVTREYKAIIKNRLNDNGIYLMNLVDSNDDPRLLKSVYRTLQQEFKQVHIYIQNSIKQSARLTYVIVAGKNIRGNELIKSKISASRSWTNVTSDVIAKGTPLEALPVLSDDYAPVDRLISHLLLQRK